MSTVLVALPPHELALFFPSGSQCIHDACPVPVRFFNPRDASDRERWQAEMLEHTPGVLISAWSTPKIPEQAERLRYACHLCGSVRNLVPRDLIAKGLLVTNWGESVAETVAEAALMMTLSALRRSHDFARIMHADRGWMGFPAGARSLFGRRVGLHGFGASARQLVKLLRPFRVLISAYSDGLPAQYMLEHDVHPAGSLPGLFAENDIVVELESLTPATRGMVDAAILGQLRDGAVFINVGRGPVVNEQALITLAQSGRVGIALDVYNREPLAGDSPLRGLPGVTLFPHVAAPTDDRVHECGAHALANIHRYFRGEQPIPKITLEIFDRST